MKINKSIPVFVLLLVAFLAFVGTASAAPALQAVEPGNTTIDFLTQLVFGLAVTVPGFAAFGVVLINLLKIPGWVPGDKAPIFLNIFNVLSAVAIGVLALFFPQINIPAVDKTFGTLTENLGILLPSFMLLYKWVSPLFYQAVRGVPVVGYSNTLNSPAKKK